MALKWTKRASRNLEAILEYIAQDNPAASRTMLALILKKVSMLEDQPMMGKAGILPQTRELMAHENYVIHYRVKDGEVQVLRVLHTRRKFP